jgi:hypothetical protein
MVVVVAPKRRRIATAMGFFALGVFFLRAMQRTYPIELRCQGPQISSPVTFTPRKK